METLTPVYVSRWGDFLTVACNVHMARQITQDLARTRDHVAECPDCRADVSPAQYAKLIALFDDVFMHIDDDAYHEVRVYDPDRTDPVHILTGTLLGSAHEKRWQDEHHIPDCPYEAMFGSAMMSVLSNADDWRCHGINDDLYVYDRCDADYGTEDYA